LQRQMMKSKIHRATVTAADLDYIGSITIDADLMRAADLLIDEQVHVWDLENGSRWVTYAIEGEPGSGAIEINGAAAHLTKTGNKVIIASFAAYDESELSDYQPRIVHVDDANRAVDVSADSSVLETGATSWVDEIPGALR
jgi:aspartate 1-decarboxylase